MENLQIIAHLSSSFAASDDWTPQLEGVVIYQILDQLGLACPNPSPEQVKVNMAKIDHLVPIKKNKEYGFYYCSNPIYSYKTEEQSKYRKRWDVGDIGYIEWGKRKAKVDTSQGVEKNYDLPVFLRLTPRIDWFCIGNQKEIESLLSRVTSLGKKRSQGFGQVSHWQIKKTNQDYSILKDGKLTKSLPVKVCEDLGITDLYDTFFCGWKPPAWMTENKALCKIPQTVKRVN